MSNRQKLKPKDLPNRFEVTLQHRKKLKLKQRLQVLFGWSVQCDIFIRVDKRTGQVWERTIVTASKLPPEVTPDDLTEQQPTTK
jgi:hypothetical protein